MMIPYKAAKVYNGDTEWYVSFYYWSLAKEKYVRKKVCIAERNLTKADRQEYLNDLCSKINELIVYRNRNRVYHEEEKVSLSTFNRIVDWADRAKLDEELEEERKSNISAFKTRWLKFEEQYPQYKDLCLDEVNVSIAKLYVKFLKAEKLAGKTVNNHIWSLEKISDYALMQGQKGLPIALTNFRIDHPRNESGRYPPLTFSEKESAFNYFRKHNPHYYLFLLHVYYTCIRPAELHRLKIKDFDLRGKKIFIPWFSSKNGLSNYVQILEPLLAALMDFKIDRYDPEMYLFDIHCKPSFTIYEGDAHSKAWMRNRVEMNMPTEKQMYGLKHTFNVDYVENNKGNIDWEWLRRHNRHATIQQTQQYISTVTAYFLDERKAKIINHHKS